MRVDNFRVCLLVGCVGLEKRFRTKSKSLAKNNLCCKLCGAPLRVQCTSLCAVKLSLMCDSNCYRVARPLCEHILPSIVARLHLFVELLIGKCWIDVRDVQFLYTVFK